MEEQEPRQIFTLSLERDEKGKIHALTDCTCQSRFEFETIIHYMDSMRKAVIKNAKDAGNDVSEYE